MKKYQISMIVTDETIRDFNIPKEKIVCKWIGGKPRKEAIFDVTEDVYKAYMQPTWAEETARKRAKRCMIPGRSGKLIRCPDENKCSECSHCNRKDNISGQPLSLDSLIEDGAMYADASSSFENETEWLIVLEQLITTLEQIHPKYGIVFRRMFDGATQPEIADELGVRQSNISYWQEKIRTILQEKIKEFL